VAGVFTSHYEVYAFRLVKTPAGEAAGDALLSVAFIIHNFNQAA